MTSSLTLILRTASDEVSDEVVTSSLVCDEVSAVSVRIRLERGGSTSSRDAATRSDEVEFADILVVLVARIYMRAKRRGRDRRHGDAVNCRQNDCRS